MVSEFQDDFEPDEPQTSSKQNVFYKNSNNEMKSNVQRKRGTSDGSSEIELDRTVPEDCDMKQTNDEFDSTINSEISEITSEAFDAWMGTDSKWRRSPEGRISIISPLFIIGTRFSGGEDVSAVSQTLDYSGSTVYDDSTSVTSSNVHMELLSSKHSRSSANVSINSDSDGNNMPSIFYAKKEKKKKDKEKVFCK